MQQTTHILSRHRAGFNAQFRATAALISSRSQVVLGNARVQEAVLRRPHSATARPIAFPITTSQREKTTYGSETSNPLFEFFAFHAVEHSQALVPAIALRALSASV